MHLSDEALQEFRALWEEEHPGETISDAELRDMAFHVLRAVDAVYRPIPRERVSAYPDVNKDTPAQSSGKETLRDDWDPVSNTR